MRKLGMLVGLLSIVWSAWGCHVVQKCPEAGAGGDGALDAEASGCAWAPGGEGGSGGDGGVGGQWGAGGIGGEGGGENWWRPDEFVDEEGICRSSDFRTLGCAPTFDEALLERSHCGPGSVCAGTCGDWLVVHFVCLPGLGCTYDPVSRTLVGVLYGNDVFVHCGGTSHTVIYGDGYHGCSFTDLVIADGCWER